MINYRPRCLRSAEEKHIQRSVWTETVQRRYYPVSEKTHTCFFFGKEGARKEDEAARRTCRKTNRADVTKLAAATSVSLQQQQKENK